MKRFTRLALAAGALVSALAFSLGMGGVSAEPHCHVSAERPVG